MTALEDRVLSSLDEITRKLDPVAGLLRQDHDDAAIWQALYQHAAAALLDARTRAVQLAHSVRLARPAA